MSPTYREQQSFPTRNYPYRAAIPPDAAPLSAPPAADLPRNTLLRFVLGLDAAPRPFTPEELAALDDPFGRLLRQCAASGTPFPLTLRQLLTAVDALAGTPDALPRQLVFLAADGGHVVWTPETDRLERAFRFVVARGRGEFPLLVSSSTVVESPEDQAFLQIIGWDESHGVFHYYERRSGTYLWAGMSTHALDPATRGQGPFDSHVNGSLVMKELRAPWVNWHAPQAGINEDALAPDDPLRDEPLFKQRVSAERLETEIVMPGIRRWNALRVQKAVDAGQVWRQVPHFLRQVVTDTTVNLATADTASGSLTENGVLQPPASFFLNRDTLFNTLGLLPDDPELSPITIPARLYLECLHRYDVHRSDGRIRVAGDTHFPFLTPEPAFEDTDLTAALVNGGLLTEQFVACLSMVDFTNPVFSPRRARLLRYVPEQVAGPDWSGAFAGAFVAALQAAVASDDQGAGQPDSPEREFLDNWQTGEWQTTFTGRIRAYWAALQAGSKDPGTVDGWFRLAEYRRRCFRQRRLAEFALTTPVTNIPADAPPLRMNSQGRAEILPPMLH